MLDKLHKVFIKKPNKDGKFSEHLAGRFVSHDGHTFLLEDYHGLLSHVLGNGPMGYHEMSHLDSLKRNPYFKVEPYSGEEEVPEPTPTRSAFEYYSGEGKPKVIEFVNGVPHLDGIELPQHEIDTIKQNVHSGKAKIRYRFNELEHSIKKMEKVFKQLKKNSHPDTEQIGAAFNFLRNLMATHPEAAKHERTFADLIYKDGMVPEVGSKLAFDDFKSRPRDGVHIMMDGNDFKHINDQFGHGVGDQAIKTFGQAMRAAADEVAPHQSKLFRAGGDEFAAHMPTLEHAAKFARKLREKLDAIPPIGGAHKLSMSFGFGHNPETADQALYEAKKQKFHPQNPAERQYRVGSAPNMAHSLVPGSEGAVPLSPTQS